MRFVIRVSIEAEKPSEPSPIPAMLMAALPLILDSLGVKLPDSPDCPEEKPDDKEEPITDPEDIELR